MFDQKRKSTFYQPTSIYEYSDKNSHLKFTIASKLIQSVARMKTEIINLFRFKNNPSNKLFSWWDDCANTRTCVPAKWYLEITQVILCNITDSYNSSASKRYKSGNSERNDSTCFNARKILSDSGVNNIIYNNDFFQLGFWTLFSETSI